MERLGVESGPHLAGVVEPTVSVVAEEQCAEFHARAARFGVPADHELLPVFAFELKPVL